MVPNKPFKDTINFTSNAEGGLNLRKIEADGFVTVIPYQPKR